MLSAGFRWYPHANREGDNMLPINEAAAALGLTPRQTYRRVSTLRPILAPFIRRGDAGKLLLDSSALEMLRRAEALRSEGLTITDAMATIRDEMSGSAGGEPGRATGNVNPLRELIEEKDRRIHALESEVAWLRAQVDELRPLALPRPRWWLRWFRPLSVRAGAD